MSASRGNRSACRGADRSATRRGPREIAFAGPTPFTAPAPEPDVHAHIAGLDAATSVTTEQAGMSTPISASAENIAQDFPQEMV